MITWRQINQWIEECLNEGRYLSSQETNFLETLNDRLRLNEPVSEEELMRLETIHAEKVP